MFDGSTLPLSENIKISKKVCDYAHKFDVSVETELGSISGIEDKNTKSKNSCYTDVYIVKDFVKQTRTDSLAIAIGTAHGAYKRKSKNEKLRFDILEQIIKEIPKIPLVLHGASSIPQKFVNNINKFGGNIKNAYGIPPAQLRKAISLHITKINVESDSRLAFTSAVREYLYKNKNAINPRDYLSLATETITKNCIDEIQNIMGELFASITSEKFLYEILRESKIQNNKNGSVNVELGAARALVFEIDDKNIEKLSNPQNVLQQNFLK